GARRMIRERGTERTLPYSRPSSSTMSRSLTMPTTVPPLMTGSADAVLDHQSYRCIDPRIRVDRDHGRAAPPQQLPDAHGKNLRLAGVWITGRAIHVPRDARQDTGEGAARRCR